MATKKKPTNVTEDEALAATKTVTAFFNNEGGITAASAQKATATMNAWVRQREAELRARRNRQMKRKETQTG